MNEYQEKLERVAKAAKIIFDVTAVSGIRTKQIECPHGNIPSYPTHAWWCDKCFRELEEALQDLESFQQSVQPTRFCACGEVIEPDEYRCPPCREAEHARG